MLPIPAIPATEREQSPEPMPRPAVSVTVRDRKELFSSLYFGTMQTTRTCSACHGTGKTVKGALPDMPRNRIC